MAKWQVYIASQYARWAAPRRMPWLPSSLHVETTTQCNLTCTICPRTEALRRAATQDREQWNQSMSFEQFRAILNQFDNLHHIRLHGLGEPLMNPELGEMVDFATRRSIHVGFSTNAVLLSPSLSRQLIQAGLSYLIVSLDGATPGVYEKIRVGASFEAVIENVRAFAAIKAELHRQSPMLAINMVVTRANLCELGSVLRLAKSLEAQEVRAAPLEPPSDEALSWLPEHQEWQAAARAGQALAQQIGIAFEDFHASAMPHKSRLGVRPWSGCCLPWLSAYITVNGYVTPCCNIADQSVLGKANVFEHSFDEIWNGEAYQGFRQQLHAGRLPFCSRCPLNSV